MTVSGAADEAEADLAGALASAGINVTRNAAHPTDLVLVAAAAARPVLPAALSSGRPDQAVGLHVPGGLGEGNLAEVVRTRLSSEAAVESTAALACRPGPAKVLAGLQAMHAAYGYPAFAPPLLLAEHAAAGLGFAKVGPAH